MRARRHLRLDVIEPPLKVLRRRHLARLDIDAAAHLGDQARTFVLRLALCPPERVPLPLTLAGLRIAYVEHDGEVAG